MKTSQKIAILILLIAHAACWLTGKEFWPFSPYPMYSKPFNPNEYRYYSLYAIDEKGVEWKVPVVEYLFPFWEASFMEALFARPDSESRKVFLTKMLELYEGRRIFLKKDWPPTKTFRLYQTAYKWETLVQKQMAGEPAFQIEPERKKVFLEVSIP